MFTATQHFSIAALRSGGMKCLKGYCTCHSFASVADGVEIGRSMTICGCWKNYTIADYNQHKRFARRRIGTINIEDCVWRG
jgi:hypothetical protein